MPESFDLTGSDSDSSDSSDSSSSSINELRELSRATTSQDAGAKNSDGGNSGSSSEIKSSSVVSSPPNDTQSQKNDTSTTNNIQHAGDSSGLSNEATTRRTSKTDGERAALLNETTTSTGHVTKKRKERNLNVSHDDADKQEDHSHPLDHNTTDPGASNSDNGNDILLCNLPDDDDDDDADDDTMEHKPTVPAWKSYGYGSDASSVDSYRELQKAPPIEIETREEKLRDIRQGVYVKEDYEFCCANCRCRGVDVPSIEDYSFWSNHHTLHRRCCHGFLQKEVPEDWLSRGEREYFKANAGPIRPVAVIDRYFDPLKSIVYPEEAIEHFQVIEGRNQRKDDNDNADKSCDHMFVAATSEKHMSNLKRYDELIADPDFKPREDGIIVIDFFAGQGTGLVALQKNGIRVKKYIAVEFDPVAVFVLKYNHDANFRRRIVVEARTFHDDDTETVHDGNITEMVYIEAFEEIEGGLQELLKKHGPIDLALGSPPCQDYSKVNGKREGVTGEQGSYHLRLGLLIQEIKRLQEAPVFFLVENVSTSGDDCAKLETAYGIPPIHVNAKDYSPTRRYRAFHTNLPLKDVPAGFGKIVGAKSCLQDGYGLPGDLTGSQGAKAWTFMASKNRIDASTMKVAKDITEGKPVARTLNVEKREYVYRTMNVVERCRMIGYHDTYVTEPLQHLFQTLQETLQGGRYKGHEWPNDLKQDYYCFSGLQYNFHREDSLEIAAPPSGLQYVLKSAKSEHGQLALAGRPVCFSEEGYGKHLVGNAYSVPVVAMLLSPLKALYKTGDQYEGLQYFYYWMELVAYDKLKKDLHTEDLRIELQFRQVAFDEATSFTALRNALKAHENDREKGKIADKAFEPLSSANFKIENP